MSSNELETKVEGKEKLKAEAKGKTKAQAKEPTTGVKKEPKTEIKEELRVGAKREPEAKKPSKGVKEGAKAMTKEEIVATIKDMTVMELADLVKTLENEFGVSAAPVAAAAPVASAQLAEAPVEEEKTEFTITLKDIGANKINVIKAVREVTTLSLKEAKDLVESAPQVIKEKATKEEVAVIKEKLEAAGATVEIK
jgi:large subunit ribosomal protein L7/L12